MNTELPQIEGLSADLLCRYVEMRKSLDAEAKTIFSLSSLLALLQHCGDDRIEVDPAALGYVNASIRTGILNIWEILDDFISIAQAQLELERIGK